MGQIENNICDAINILVNKAISGIQLDKTVLCTVESCVDEGLRQYRVKYQDSSFLAYAQGENKYRKNTKVYVLIPSNNISEDRLILGTVDKLGNSYVNNLSVEDKITKIGPNIFRNPENCKIELCSYYNETKDCGLNIDSTEIDFYQKDASCFFIAADFQTDIPLEQQGDKGDYGIIITCNYYNDNKKAYYTRDYIIHASTMIGNKYIFTIPTRQSSMFLLEPGDILKDEIKDDKLIRKAITVKAFSNNFPKAVIEVTTLPEVGINGRYYKKDNDYYKYIYNEETQKSDWKQVDNPNYQSDIFILNFEYYFAETLTADELAGAALKIITPKGSRFTTNINELILQADIKIQGSFITEENTKDIDYYWFVRDLNITEDSDKYYYLGGENWRCLNKNSYIEKNESTGEETINDIDFVADIYKKTILKSDYNYSKISFKCMAVLDEYVLSDIIIVTNEDAEYNIVLDSKYGTAFPFDNYNSTITAHVYAKNDPEIDLVSPDSKVKDEFKFTWGYETEDGMTIIAKSDIKSNVLTHDPFGNQIKYIVTVKRNDEFKGSAEIVLVNEQKQPDYTLVLENGNQVFKYTVEGTSPASKSIPTKDRQVVEPLFFNLYNKLGDSVGKKDDGADERAELLDITWYFPAKDTMLIIGSSTENMEEIEYNGKWYYKFKKQLSFTFTIKNEYNKQFSNNDIILEIQYKGLIYTTSTNFTITKEGELGTNGTNCTARISPGTTINPDIQQVYIRNNIIKTCSYPSDDKITFKTYSNSNGFPFYVEVWDGGTSFARRETDKDVNWEFLPVLDNNTNLTVKYKTTGSGAQKRNIGTIYVDGTAPMNRAIIVQGCLTDNSLSKSQSATEFYASYSLPVMNIRSSNEYDYIITGGYNEVQYASNGKVSSYVDTPFTLKLYNNKTGEEISSDNPISPSNPDNYDNIEWRPSWFTSSEDPIKGNNITIPVPSRLDTLKNNYITITYKINNQIIDVIIWSVNFYFNRYSMGAMNGWDGQGIEIKDDDNKKYILAPQIAAGEKEHSKNLFTGVAIGKCYEETDVTNTEVGLFGYNKGDRTIFLNAENGSATFGKSYKDSTTSESSGCLQIIPGEYSNNVTINTYGAKAPTWNTTDQHLKGGIGGEIYFNSQENESGKVTNSNGHLFLGNSFYVDEIGNAYFSGRVNAYDGHIGSWTIGHGTIDETDPASTTGGALIGQVGDNIIQLDPGNLKLEAANNNDILWSLGIDNDDNGYFTVGKENDLNSYIAFRSGYLKINSNHEYGSFNFSNSNSSFSFDNSGFNINNADLSGDGWNINANGDFHFGNNDTYIEFDQDDNEMRVLATIGPGDINGNDWFIDESGDFRLAGGKLSFINNNFKLDMSGAEGTVALGGKLNFTYKEIPIQGNECTPTTSYNTTIDCWQLPGITTFVLHTSPGDKIDWPEIVTGLPKPKEYCYFTVLNDDNSEVYVAQLTSNGELILQFKTVKNRNYYITGVYPSNDE